MFKVDEDGRTIILHRGDKGIIPYSINSSETEKYKFQVGDIVNFIIYAKKGYAEEPLLNKKIIVEAETEEVNLEFSSEDMEIGEISNKPITYWYEILLNNVQTINGYDQDEGPAKLIILPSNKEV